MPEHKFINAKMSTKIFSVDFTTLVTFFRGYNFVFSMISFVSLFLFLNTVLLRENVKPLSAVHASSLLVIPCRALVATLLVLVVMCCQLLVEVTMIVSTLDIFDGSNNDCFDIGHFQRKYSL